MASPFQLDPTRATSIRRSFRKELENRYAEFYRGLYKAIVEEDILGLLSFNPALPVFNAGDKDSVKRLADKAQELADKTINGKIATGHWTDKFTRLAHKLGLRRAQKNATPQTGQPALDQLNTESTIANVEAGKVAQSTLGRIASKTAELVKAAAQKVVSTVVRIVSDVLGKKEVEPKEVVAAIKPEIQKAAEQAKVIVETQTTSAHAEGQLDMLVALGIEEVSVWVEFMTAGDNKVCPRCAALDGKIMTIDQARNVIPVHPNCRCAFRVLRGVGKSRKPKGPVLSAQALFTLGA